MKTKLTGVVAIAMVLTIAFSGVALASQPACTTPETETIKTVTMIKCNGSVTETEKVSWETSNEDLINNPPLADEEVVGKMDYYEDMKVTDGTTNFIKDMGVDTGDAPNLNVMKSIGYGQGDTIGSLSHTEEVSLGIVAAPTLTEEVVLCPFASRATEGWWVLVDPVTGLPIGAPFLESVLPASCEDVKASSKMVVTEVLATTVTRVDISESPLELHYEVDATGLDGAGSPAVGHIAAEFNVYTEDGSAWTGRHCGLGNPINATLGSKLTHYEKSTADGLWEFHKEMDYDSKIRP